MILDPHIHSRCSYDSLSAPSDLLRAAKRKGLDAIAITDHNTVRGGLDAQALAQGGQVLVIAGAEIATEAGDLVGLFLAGEIESRRGLDVVEEIHRQGGIAVLPHPFKGHTLNDELLRAVDAVEGFNSRCSPEQNRRAMELARQYGKPTVAGSDAHTCAEVGRARVILEPGDLRSGLLSGAAALDGRYSPSHAESLSQLIKALKTGRYAQTPRWLASVVLRVLRLRGRRDGRP